MDSLRILIIFSMTARTWVSSSWMRSSTSRCLMAEVIMRIVPRRSASLARIAAFMSSVTRSLSDDMGLLSRREERGRRASGSIEPELIAPGKTLRSVSAGRASAAAAAAIAGDALHVALHGGGFLALTFLRRLFVEFPAAQLGQDPGLFAGALEAPQGGIEVLVFSDANARPLYLGKLDGRSPLNQYGVDSSRQRQRAEHAEGRGRP